MMQMDSDYDYNNYAIDTDAPILPTPQSKIEPPYAYRDRAINYRKFQKY